MNTEHLPVPRGPGAISTEVRRNQRTLPNPAVLHGTDRLPAARVGDRRPPVRDPRPVPIHQDRLVPNMGGDRLSGEDRRGEQGAGVCGERCSIPPKGVELAAGR